MIETNVGRGIDDAKRMAEWVSDKSGQEYGRSENDSPMRLSTHHGISELAGPHVFDFKRLLEFKGLNGRQKQSLIKGSE